MSLFESASWQAQPGEREGGRDGREREREREREGSETLPYHQWRPEIKIWSSKGHISNERVYSVCIPPIFSL
jgi:hypothetical protein